MQPKSLNGFLNETNKLATEVKRKLILRKPSKSAIGRHLVATNDNWSSIELTDADVRRDVPSNSSYFQVSIIGIEDSIYNHKFVLSMGKSGFAKKQRTINPEIIYVSGGIVDLPNLHSRLRELGFGDEYIKRDGKNYVLRKPIIIAPSATLVISGENVAEFRMSQDRGAYIVNAGSLYIVDTHVVGWNEKSQQTATADYSKKYDFRPFILAWSRSDSHFAGNLFEALGYNNAKAYGFSFSSGPKELTEFYPEKVKRPSGRVVNNSFKNMYYGFYSFEAKLCSCGGQ